MMELLRKFHKLLSYLFFSILSTVLDVAVVSALLFGLRMDITVANTVGMVAGFILSYVLSSRRVFQSEYGPAAFLIYFLTFLFGLVFADFLITVSNRALLPYCGEWLAFLLSKGVSIVLPFFVLYFIRKFLYQKLNQRRASHG